MILQAEGLRKLYGEFCALDGVSLGVDAGEFVSIVGPNGAGKSTLLKAIAGLLRPKAGTIALHGRDITGLPPREIGEHLKALVREGITILLIEHHMDMVARLCDHVIVLAEGRRLAEGSFDEVGGNSAVQEAYMGRRRAKVG